MYGLLNSKGALVASPFALGLLPFWNASYILTSSWNTLISLRVCCNLGLYSMAQSWFNYLQVLFPHSAPHIFQWHVSPLPFEVTLIDQLFVNGNHCFVTSGATVLDNTRHVGLQLTMMFLAQHTAIALLSNPHIARTLLVCAHLHRRVDTRGRKLQAGRWNTIFLFRIGVGERGVVDGLNGCDKSRNGVYALHSTPQFLSLVFTSKALLQSMFAHIGMGG